MEFRSKWLRWVAVSDVGAFSGRNIYIATVGYTWQAAWES